MIRGGEWFVTPLLVAMVAIEEADMLFAVESVPAVLSVPRSHIAVLVEQGSRAGERLQQEVGERRRRGADWTSGLAFSVNKPPSCRSTAQNPL